MLEGAEVRRRARAGFSPYRRGPLSSTPSLARHTLDADHVAAVAILLSHRPNLRMSGIIGLWWGFGHTVVLFLAGIAIFVLKLRVPEGLSHAAEFGVGLLLVVLGGSLAVTMIQERWHVHVHRHDGQHHLHWHSHRQGPPNPLAGPSVRIGCMPDQLLEVMGSMGTQGES